MEKYEKYNLDEETEAALAKACFLELMKEDEDRGKGKVFPVKEEIKPVKEPKVDLNQVVEACMKQLQALQASKKQSERPRSSWEELRCWCCNKEGHLMRACPVIQENKAVYGKKKDEKKMVSDGARGCQMMQKDARGCQMFPESASVCQRVPDGNRGYLRVPAGTRWSQRVPKGARGYQMVLVGTKWCQSVPECGRMAQLGQSWPQDWVKHPI